MALDLREENKKLQADVKDLREMVDGFRKYGEMLESQYQLFENREGPGEDDEIGEVPQSVKNGGREWKERSIKIEKNERKKKIEKESN